MNEIPERYIIGRCKLWPRAKEVIDISADFITQQGKMNNFTIANLPDYDFFHDDKSIVPYGMQKFHACLMASAQEMFEIVSAAATSNDLNFIRREAKKVLREIEAHREWLEDVYNYKQKSG